MNNFESGVYCEAIPCSDSHGVLCGIMCNQNVPNPIAQDELHCTVQYSTASPNKDTSLLNDFPIDCDATVKGVEVWKTQSGKNCLVLTLDSPKLSRLHKNVKDLHGLSYGFDEYKPHVTFSYDLPDGYDTAKLKQEVVGKRLNFDKIRVKPLEK